ncbi:universal stress protein [Phaeodactylibacter luteus]|uniref:Universal stress protein n=2 Tax=Phaeodactylibacter luteus TaxID=1564516 RepID=A0A5C6RIZ6_9BACT|nr:universal stress protein [Phaeodactylibacter luteus]
MAAPICKSQKDRTMKNPAKAVSPLAISQVLVALELGQSDEATLQYLHHLCGQLPVQKLHFLHVLPRFDALHAFPGRETANGLNSYEVNEEVRQQMEERIQAALGDNAALQANFEIREGEPLEELLNEAKESDADLLVIGQNSGEGRHGILGKNLARRSTANVWVVPDHAKAQIHHILVPIDFSAYSTKALKAAIALRDELSGAVQITALHVYEMPDLSVYKIQRTPAQFERMLRKDHEEAFEAFLHTHFPKEKEGIATRLVLKEGPGIAHYLMGTARESGADLIIMGAKGHSKVERLLLGSVTERLLMQNEQTPVLVVK